MSYCRWSSCDFRSDVYVYADVGGGYTTHVAGNRVAFNSPLPPPVPFSTENAEAWVEREKAVSEMLRAGTKVEIGHPLARKSFNDPTPSACVDRLLYLRGEGFEVPQHAIDALLAEAEESGA